MPADTRILLVDDDNIDRRAIKRAFRKQQLPYPIVEACDGEEAWELLNGRGENGPLEKPFIVLLDLNMPRVNGHQLLARMRAEPGLADTIVFVLTTSMDPQDINLAYRANVAGYMTKQVSDEHVIRNIRLLDLYINSVEFPGANA